MAAPPESERKPVVIITIGMAGAGKSTFVQRINSFLHAKSQSAETASSSSVPSDSAAPAAGAPDWRPPYILNLDPAITHVPFEPNIDIRDTVDYKEVMKQ